MMKIAFLIVCAFALAQGQVNVGSGLGIGGIGGIAGLGFPTSQFFQDIVLQAEAQKLLIQSGLPEDLRQRVADVLANAETGFNNCNTIATLPWIRIRCVMLQLQKSKNELKAIEDEALARAATTTAASV